MLVFAVVVFKHNWIKLIAVFHPVSHVEISTRSVQEKAVAGRWPHFPCGGKKKLKINKWQHHTEPNSGPLFCIFLSATEKRRLCATVIQPPPSVPPQALIKTVQIEGSRWGPIWCNNRPSKSPFQLADLEAYGFKKSSHQTVTAVCNMTLSCPMKADSEAAHILTLWTHMSIIRQTPDTR